LLGSKEESIFISLTKPHKYSCSAEIKGKMTFVVATDTFGSSTPQSTASKIDFGEY